MTEMPILMNGDMVRAILDGRKTQTRRPVKPQPSPFPERCLRECKEQGDLVLDDHNGKLALYWHTPFSYAPFGKPGDHLWVRETFGFDPNIDALLKAEGHTPGDLGPRDIEVIGYKADVGRTAAADAVQRWRPSIHMPRWASRLTLEIERVWIERLMDISEADAVAEGWPGADIEVGHTISGNAAINWFFALWASIYEDQRSLMIHKNPWVYACRFHLRNDSLSKQTNL
jgi:hypothetical protein